MWELINANKRRSVLLAICLLALLLALGFVIGAAAFPADYADPDGLIPGVPINLGAGFVGMGIAGVVWFFQMLVAYFQGDAILMASSGARRIEKEDHPRLFNVVEEMVIASRLPKVPDIYIIDDPAMNAFAAGRKPETSKVAITSGLLAKLDRDQLQGVMAHELAHVVHRDVLFMTLIGVTLGAIVLLSEVFLRSLRHMGGSRYSGGSRGKGNGAQIILVVVAVVLAILAPILAQLIYFAVSRRREYLADAGAAVYTRYPEGLAQALEVLSGQSAKLERVSKATAPMFIVNPLNPSARAAFSMFATHPPSEQRIQVLRGMAGGASFAAYQSAWRKVDRNAKMPATLVAETGAALREASPEALQERAAMQQDNPRDRKRDTGDLLRKLNDFVFIPCACGMRIKLPPTWSEPTAQCPRCGTMHAVPMAGLAVAANVLQQQGIPFRKAKEQATPPPMPSGRTVQKPRDAWATIQCSCGAKKTLSPSFNAPQTLCSNCGKAIDVEIT